METVTFFIYIPEIYSSYSLLKFILSFDKNKAKRNKLIKSLKQLCKKTSRKNIE